jgi:hypothetical protein
MLDYFDLYRKESLSCEDRLEAAMILCTEHEAKQFQRVTSVVNGPPFLLPSLSLYFGDTLSGGDDTALQGLASENLAMGRWHAENRPKT